MSDGRLELRITDNGMGIRPENADKLFKPLFSTKSYGVGLGLPLVKRIMEQHNGRINIESEWMKGTTITIWLPLAPTDGQHYQPLQSGASELDTTK